MAAVGVHQFTDGKHFYRSLPWRGETSVEVFDLTANSARYTRRSYPSARACWHEDGNVLRTYGLIRRQRRFLSRQKLPGVEPRARRASFASCRVRDVSASCRVRGLVRGVCSIYHIVCSTDGSTWTADAWLRHVRLLAVGPRLVAVPSSQVSPDVLPFYGLALERRTERRASIGRRLRRSRD